MSKELLSDIYYEAKPFICAILGVVGIYLANSSTLVKFLGAFLVVSGLGLFYLRAKFRGLIQ